MHMIYDKILEKHKLMNKLRMTSIHNEIYKYAHKQKSIHKIPMTGIHFINNQIYAQQMIKNDCLSRIDYCTPRHLDPLKLLL